MSMMQYWVDVGIVYKLNEVIRERRVVIVKDYIVVYGIPDEWVEVMNLKEKKVVFRVDFEPIGGIDLGISKVEFYPDEVGFNIFNFWLSGLE